MNEKPDNLLRGDPSPTSDGGDVSLWPFFMELCERLKGDTVGVEVVSDLLYIVGYDKVDVTKDPEHKAHFEEATKV